ncbi:MULTISPECIES: triacylglycerol lipase [unclassified Acidovorax]|uniref:esterase/lipase family protein n=1 Tax=unclassified Acidovorax TaxID=2684926 RepID=UPI0028834440|nr:MULTISPECIES: triacylglycerol lipase [unclassified Acidovorax]
MHTILRHVQRARALATGTLLVFALAFTFTTSTAHAQASGTTQTRYPIVLVHGLFGFKSLLGVDMFYGIPQALQRDGAQVFVAEVSGANSSEVRGEQLLAQVKDILAITGAAKVNLIGHSHGGPTVRYVSGVAPQLVASVTTVGGVNRGSRVADAVRGVLPAGSVQESVANQAVKAVAQLLALLAGSPDYPQVPKAALESLTTSGAAAFNRRFPQGLPDGCGDGASVVNGVRYYSWTGTRPVTNVLDPSDAFLALLAPVHGEANDGLVSACSSRLGKHLGDYRQNHLDEINQFVGLRDLFSVDPVTLYRQHAQRLKAQGL